MPTKNKPSRLVNRNGELNLKKNNINSFRLFHYLQGISWQLFLGYAFGFYILVNFLFSIAYYLLGGADCLNGLPTHHVDNQSVRRQILEIFYFSTQTFTTVGYGHIRPNCDASNMIASVESFLGLLFFAVVTGLFYTKFTKPLVEIKWSDRAVFDRSGDGLAFKFILANEYENKLLEVEANLDLIKLEITEEGRYKKSFYHMNLKRDKVPFLSVPWTVVHVIDENSPLKGMTKAFFENAHIEFFVQVKVYDDVHNRLFFKEFSYFGKEEVSWGHAYQNIQTYTNTGALSLDMKRFGSTIELTDFPNIL